MVKWRVIIKIHHVQFAKERKSIRIRNGFWSHEPWNLTVVLFMLVEMGVEWHLSLVFAVSIPGTYPSPPDNQKCKKSKA